MTQDDIIRMVHEAIAQTDGETGDLKGAEVL